MACLRGVEQRLIPEMEIFDGKSTFLTEVLCFGCVVEEMESVKTWKIRRELFVLEGGSGLGLVVLAF